MSHSISARTTAVVLLLTMVTALVFSASPANATPASDFAAMNMILMYESDTADSPVLGVTARLADDIELPVEIALPIPEGARVMWGGQFFLEEGRENIPAKFTQELRGGVPVAVFMLTESRIGHVEVVFPSSMTPVDIDKGVNDTGFSVILPAETGNLYAAIALPEGVEAIQGLEGLSVKKEADGLTYHSREWPSGASGDEIGFSIRTQDVTPHANDTAGRGLLAFTVLLIIGTAAWLMVRTRKRT